MVKTRPKAPNAGKENQNAAQPTRKRRASNIASQRNPAPRAKRSRTDKEQSNVEDETAVQDEEEEEEVENELGQVRQHDRFSSVEVLPSSPPLKYQSTTITQKFAEATIQSTPLAPRPTKSARGRQSMPAQLNVVSSDVEVRQFTPFSEVLDGRQKRRLSRNHLSEEQNSYTGRLHELRKQLKQANDRIEEVEFRQEADRQMGAADTLDDEKDQLIEQLKRDKVRLEEDLAEHEAFRPQEDEEENDHDVVMDADALDFPIHSENVLAHTDTGGPLTHPHAQHASCRAIVDGYQNDLLASGIEHARLTTEAEGMRIRLQGLGFPTPDDNVLSIVSTIHEVFINARSELSKLEMLSDEEFADMNNADFVQHMVMLLKVFRAHMATLTVTNKELLVEIDHLQESVEAIDILKDTLDRENDSLLRDKVELESDLAESQAREEKLSNANKEFQHEISTLKKEHEEKMSRIADDMSEAHRLREESEQEKDAEIAKLREQLNEAFEAEEAATEGLVEAGIDTDKLLEGIAELRRRREAEQRQREHAEQSLDEAHAKIELLEPQLAEANSKIGSLELEKNKLKSDLFSQQTQKEAAIAAMDEAVEDHKAAVAQLQKSHGTAMETEVALRQSIIAGMDQTIAEERETGMKLHRKADSLKEENQHLEDQLATATIRNEDLDEKNNGLRSTIAELEMTISALTSSIEGHENTIEQHEATILELSNAIEGHEATIAQYEATVRARDVTIQALEAAIGQHEGTIRARNTAVEEQNVTIEEYKETINRLTMDVAEKDGAITDFEDDLRQLRQKHATSEKKVRHYEAIFNAAEERNVQISQSSQQLSQLLFQRHVVPELGDEIYDELADEEINEDEEEFGDDTMVGEEVELASTQKAKVTTKAVHSQRTYDLRRSKEQRDSGIAMDSSPIRARHMFEGVEE